MGRVFVLEPGICQLFWRGPEKRYSRCVGPAIFGVVILLCRSGVRAALDGTVSLWSLKFEFHTIFMYHKVLRVFFCVCDSTMNNPVFACGPYKNGQWHLDDLSEFANPYSSVPRKCLSTRVPERILYINKKFNPSR